MNYIPNEAYLSVGSEITHGKKLIALAINAKGGTASATESFGELADDISNAIFDTTTDVTFVDGFAPRNAYDIIVNKDKIISLTYRGDSYSSYGLSYLTSLKNISFPDVVATFIPANLLTGSTENLDTIHFDNAVIINASQVFDYKNTNGRLEFYAEKCSEFSFGISRNFQIRKLFLGDITTLNTGGTNYFNNRYLLTISLKSGDGNLNCANWTADIVGAEVGWDVMNQYLYNDFLTKLYDHSQDGVTRTLRLDWLAYVTEENIAYANTKGWTLTT